MCTTELGTVAGMKPEFDRRNTKLIGLSVDGVADHEGWSKDIEEVTGNALNYPLLADSDLSVSKAYNMLPADVGGGAEGRTPVDNATVRTVYVIGPDKQIKAMISYPMSTGRNFDEVLRLLDSCQLTARHKVATPANWKNGEDVIIVPAVKDDEARRSSPTAGMRPSPTCESFPSPETAPNDAGPYPGPPPARAGAPCVPARRGLQSRHGQGDRDRRPAAELSGPAVETVTSPSELRGADAVRAALATMSAAPGVYRMLAGDGEVLYVGKARSLRQRLTAYAQPGRLEPRLHRMVERTSAIEVVTTATEAEALLLEANLIKRLKPRYNVVLRDDKSLPYILLRLDHSWPQVIKHRGARRRKGAYFGPFASTGAVNQTVTALQRAFPLRSCTDHVLANRTRPCLQHQIKRCVAPCAGLVEPDDYARLVGEARAFLKGRTREVQENLARRMQQAADDLDFERAASLRDRIRALNHIQAHQGINASSIVEADVVALHQAAGQCCVQVFFVRHGRNYGNRAYHPGRRAGGQDVHEVMAAFLGQFYEDKPVPRLVLVSVAPDNPALMTEALGERAGRAVEISVPQRGTRRAPDGARARQRQGRARPPPGGKRHAATAHAGTGADAGTRRAARANRGLRQQPYPGQSAGRRDDRRRPRTGS